MKQSSSIVSIGCVDADSSTVVVSVGFVAVASDIRVLAKLHSLLAALEGQLSSVVGKGNKVRRVARDGLARLEGAGARREDSNRAPQYWIALKTRAEVLAAKRAAASSLVLTIVREARRGPVVVFYEECFE